MTFDQWLYKQEKILRNYFKLGVKMEDLIKQLDSTTKLEWRPHEETGGLYALGNNSKTSEYTKTYWLDISHTGINLTVSGYYDADVFYGLSVDSVGQIVNKCEIS